MKLLRLALENFIAYRDPVEIPFKDLLEDGLLLITGPTGSGKSTIMDAIVYSLFGTRSHDRSPISQFNPIGTAKVELEFSLGSSCYRVTRSWRGGKLVSKENADLIQLRQRYALLNEKELFRKVVVIPQGEYDHLIKAPDHKRYDLLSKLLPLESVDKFADILEEMLKNLDGERLNTLSRIRHILESLPEVEVPDAQDPLDLERPLITAGENIRNALKELEKQEKRLKQEKENIEKRQRYLEVLRARVKALKDLEQALSDLGKLAEQQEEIQKKQAHFVRLQEFVTDFQKHFQEWKTLQRDIPELERRLEEARKSFQKLQQEFQSLEKELKELPEKEKEKENLTREETALGSHIRNLENLQKVLRELAELEGALQRDRDRLILFQAVRRLHLQKRYDQILGEMQKLKKRLEGLKKQLQEAHLAQHLVHLVKNLREGEPCPLCGSPHHPHPYTPSENLPSPEELEREHRKTERVLLDRAQELGELQKELKHLETQGANLSPGGIRAKATALGLPGDPEELHRRMTGEFTSPEEMEKRLRDLEQELEIREGRRKTLEEALGENFGMPEILEHRLKKTQSQLKEIQKKKKDLEETINRVRNREKELQEKQNLVAGKIQTLENALEEKTEKRNQMEMELRNLLQKARHHRNMGDLEASYKETGMIGRLQKEVERWKEAHDRAVARRDQALGNLESTGDLTELRGIMERARTAQTLEDLGAALRATQEQLSRNEEHTRAFEKALGEKEKHYEEAVRELKRREGQLNQQSQQITAGHGLIQKWKSHRPRYETLTILVQAMNRKQFVYWVTRHYLSRMLDYASEYLKAFSGDRYAFIETYEAEKIPLIVRDGFTGEQRDARHLSGGEQFMASLALALGMTRTLVEMQGSEAPGFLFIDEGFGTLDSETLTHVAQILREHARREGVDLIVISHRQELRDYFPTVLEVVPSSSGSRIRR